MLQSLCYEIFSVPLNLMLKKTLTNSNKNKAAVQEIAFGLTCACLLHRRSCWILSALCFGNSEEMTENGTEMLNFTANGKGSAFLQTLGYVSVPLQRGLSVYLKIMLAYRFLQELGSNDLVLSELLFTSVVMP